MNLAKALDFLASNCPTVFAPIATELGRLGTENDKLKESLLTTQDLIDNLLLNGGM